MNLRDLIAKRRKTPAKLVRRPSGIVSRRPKGIAGYVPRTPSYQQQMNPLQFKGRPRG